jgi:hypothetical protein
LALLLMVAGDGNMLYREALERTAVRSLNYD